MENIVSVVGKLLYFARHLHRTKEITQRELANLKDLIVSDNEELKLAYQDYLNEGTELTLKSSLIHLIHREKDSESDEVISQSSSKKNKRLNMKIVIPKRNIQKMPAGMNRV